jgi:two-component system, OmpR family, sensor histidine kinase KdpD
MVTTAALALLVVVLLVAAYARLWMAIVTAVVAMLVFNFFFLPPVGTLTIADPQNWVAFVAFVSAALIASQLSSAAHSRAREALASRNELARLFDLSRDVLLTGESSSTLDALARHITRRFELPSAAIFLRTTEQWRAHQGSEAALVIGEPQLEFALARAGQTLEFDARERAYGGQAVIEAAGGTSCTLVPLRLGTKPIGLFAAPAGVLNAGTLDAIAGLAAIAVERDQFLSERKAADLVRQQADFTSTLLASLSHDLRTPLTAIQVAMTNLDDPSLSAEARREQMELAQSELSRLSRLFRDILEMARIDSAALTPEREWVTGSDIIDATLANLQPELAGRPLKIDAETGRVAHVDPRLVSSALSHLVENAAQYSPAGTPIELKGWVDADGLHLSVTDHGPGLDPTELPRLFDRFYRGRREHARPAGTGMGLAITRGLLAVQEGRVWAENMPAGGARFSIAVPAPSRDVTAEV